MTNDPSPQPAAGVPDTPNVTALSPDAQLATALVIQSQALEGMRVAQSDLLRRIDGSAAAYQLRAAVEDIESAAEQVRRAQDDAVAALGSSRRKIVTSVALVGALIIAVVAGGVWWIDGRLSEQLPGGIDVVRAERDTLRAELAAASASAAQLESALGDEKLRHMNALGELTRVRSEYVASRSAVQDIRETLADMPGTAAATEVAAAGGIITSDGRVRATAADVSAATSINAALAASGAASLRVIEVGSVDENMLNDVLFLEVDPVSGAPLGPAARAKHGWLSSDRGHVALRLDGNDIGPGEQRVIHLSAFDVERWSDLGLTAAGSTIHEVLDALDALVGSRTRYRVVSLGGVAATTGELEDLVLKEEGSRGELIRTLVAPRARVEETGPLLAELVLSDGFVRTGDDERPFYRGVFRLNIPGADLRRWRDVLRQELP